MFINTIWSIITLVFFYLEGVVYNYIHYIHLRTLLFCCGLCLESNWRFPHCVVMFTVLWYLAWTSHHTTVNTATKWFSGFAQHSLINKCHHLIHGYYAVESEGTSGAAAWQLVKRVELRVLDVDISTHNMDLFFIFYCSGLLPWPITKGMVETARDWQRMERSWLLGSIVLI